jgi:hypothetical protein
VLARSSDRWNERTRYLPRERHLLPDHPLRLEDAVKYCFPFGGMTVSGLRREAARGRLKIERIANKDFTSLRKIEEMRKLCRVKAEDRTCGGGKSVGRVARSSHEGHGFLSTVASITPQAALLAKIKSARIPSRVHCGKVQPRAQTQGH